MSKRIVPVRWQLLEKIFLAAGFSFARQEGSHRSYVRAGKTTLRKALTVATGSETFLGYLAADAP